MKSRNAPQGSISKVIQCRPLIKPPLFGSRDPNIKALERRGFINHGSTLSLKYTLTR